MKSKDAKWYKGAIDSVRSLYIRQRYADWKWQVHCFTCEKIMDWKEMEAGHFHLRQHDFTSELAGDERNLQVQCSGCNRFMRGRPQLFALNLIKKYGNGILEELQKKKDTSKKWKIAELQALLESYKEKLTKLNG